MNRLSNIARFTSPALSCVAAALLAACSSGDSSNTSDGRSGDMAATGSLSVSITDAPVDNASEVVVQFKGVSIQPENGERLEFEFNSVKSINLLDLQGTLYTDLINSEKIPVGRYNWIRLYVNASEDGINDSYITFNDGNTYELSIPSGSQSGLKINSPFELVANQSTHLMIDFDLRQSIVESNGQYKLRPTLRMTDMGNSNNITGSINPLLVSANTCSDSDPTTGNAVYLYAGSDIEADDMNTDKRSAEVIASAEVVLNETTGMYEYTIAYIDAGNYTLAFTCQADLDDPNNNDNIVFSWSENRTVEASSKMEMANYPVR